MDILTEKQLNFLYARSNPQILAVIADSQDLYLQYGFNTPDRYAMFLAQAAVDSNFFKNPVLLDIPHVLVPSMALNIGADLEIFPSVLRRPKVGLHISLEYWDYHGLHSLADRGKFEDITMQLKGGLKDHDMRQIQLDHIRKFLGGDRISPQSEEQD